MSFKIPIRNLSKKLRKDKIVMDYDEEELDYLGSPLGKASYDYELDAPDEVTVRYEYDSIPDNSSSLYEDDSSEYEDVTDSSEYEDVTVSSEDKDELNISIIPQAPQEINYDSGVDSESSEKSEKEVVVKKKAHWKDKLECKICGGTYTRSAISGHRKTKKHQIYAKANNKFLKLMQGE